MSTRVQLLVRDEVEMVYLEPRYGASSKHRGGVVLQSNAYEKSCFVQAFFCR